MKKQLNDVHNYPGRMFTEKSGFSLYPITGIVFLAKEISQFICMQIEYVTMLLNF